MLLLLLIIGCVSSNPIVENDTVRFQIYGYVNTCENNYKIYVDDNGVWKQTEQFLPAKGQYFLDGEYIPDQMCDVMTCERLPEESILRLVEFVEVGKKMADNVEVASYQTKTIHGRIKIEYDYYTTLNCNIMKKMDMVVNN
jgi:hypothetical protein